jgi:hypothetical protein
VRCGKREEKLACAQSTEAGARRPLLNDQDFRVVTTIDFSIVLPQVDVVLVEGIVV